MVDPPFILTKDSDIIRIEITILLKRRSQVCCLKYNIYLVKRRGLWGVSREELPLTYRAIYLVL
jgi:hypothetical protein